MFHLNHVAVRVSGFRLRKETPLVQLSSFTTSPSLNLCSSLFHASNAIDDYAKHNGVRRTRVSCHHRSNWRQQPESKKQLVQDGSPVTRHTNFLKVAICNNASPLQIILIKFRASASLSILVIARSSSQLTPAPRTGSPPNEFAMRVPFEIRRKSVCQELLLRTLSQT